MVTTWPWLRTRYTSLEPSSPTSGGGQFGSPNKSRGMSGLLTSCLPLPLSSRQSVGRVSDSVTWTTLAVITWCVRPYALPCCEGCHSFGYIRPQRL